MTSAYSQQSGAVTSGAISGTVTDDSSRPIQGAIVSLAELRLQSITGANGRFFFGGIPGGDYTVVARR
ncbi:MAG: carboxypeptidase-like regulatory domain-containing protein, partial [Gemmatimonadaceae bacterium]